MPEEQVEEQVEEQEAEQEEVGFGTDEAGEDETSTPDESSADTENTEVLDELEGLKKTVSGLKHGISAERGKRQELQGRLSQVSDLFESAKGKQQPDENVIDENIPVQFDDDGNAFISPKDFKALSRAEIQAVEDKLANLEQVHAQNINANAAQKQFDNVVSESPENTQAFSQLQAARNYADKLFGEHIMTSGITPPRSIDEAMDIIERDGIDVAFSKKFPGVDIESSIVAFTSPRQMRKALKGIVKHTSGKQESMSSLKSLSSKPASHVGRSGSPGKVDLTLDTIANLSSEDFLNLSNTEINKINRLLRDSE